jgi:hypothetical protein
MDPFALTGLNARIGVGADTLVLLSFEYDTAKPLAMGFKKTLRNLEGVVLRSIINQDQLKLRVGLCTYGSQTGFDEGSVVVGRDGDADQLRFDHDYQTTSRFSAVE